MKPGETSAFFALVDVERETAQDRSPVLEMMKTRRKIVTLPLRVGSGTREDAAGISIEFVRELCEQRWGPMLRFHGIFALRPQMARNGSIP
jgi:hypothetical protein